MDPILLTVQGLGFLLNMFFAGTFMYGYLQGTCNGWVAACFTSAFVVIGGAFMWGFMDNLTQVG